MTTYTMAQALNQALRFAMDRDDRIVLLGEDVGKLGGVFRITDLLQERFGPARVMDTPLAESGIIGVAVGLCMYGMRPVAEVQFDGFVYPAFEQIISHLAKYHNRSRGAVHMPMVLRLPFGGGIGAVEHHSESPEAYFVHTAGLKVVIPSTPADAFVLLVAAIEDPDPVIFLEPKRRYYLKEDLQLPVQGPPIGQALVRREGTDVSVFAYGPSVKVAMDAAAQGAEEGRSLEVVDLRSLVPLDLDTVLGSVRKTGRAIVVHEAPRSCGFGAELAALIAEGAFYSMEAPVLRVAGYDVPYPPAKIEEEFLPSVDRILDAVDEALTYR